MSVVFSVVPIIAVLAIIVLIGYGISRVRAGQAIRLSLAAYLAAYLHLVMLIALVVLAIGLADIVNAGLSRATGVEFSYGRQRSPPRPDILTERREPEADAAARLAREQTEREAREATRLDEDFRSGLARGVALAIAGAVVYGIHQAARMALGAAAKAPQIRVAYRAVLLAVFGLAGIIAFPVALANTLDYAIQTSREFFEGPGHDVAIALVFAPFWLTLITLLVREVRSRARLETGSDAGIAAPPS